MKCRMTNDEWRGVNRRSPFHDDVRRPAAFMDCGTIPAIWLRSAFAGQRWLFLLALTLLVSIRHSSFVIPAHAADAATELASFQLADGFEINLFASETNGVVKPIQIRFDARGRLWVIGSVVYPQIEPGQKPDDKVLIL